MEIKEMKITAQQVNELRKKTGAGMMDCKKALTEADGDMEKAIEILRKKGAAVASKRAEKSANEGLIVTKISDDRKHGAISEVNCETDFVAKNKDFVNLADEVIEAVFNSQTGSVKELLDKNSDLNEKVNDLLGKVGEKIEISRIENEEAPNGILVDYVHLGSKLGVLLKFDNVTEAADELYNIGKDIAMQVAAMNPLSIYREDISKETIEKEIEIYKEVARKEGKPEQILEKITTGKLNKFYQENCLAEQSFIKDNSKTVGDLIKEFNTKYNSEVKIALFHRFHLGDENK
uniref:Elongation factor Ts n=1 Tax=uncultured bacterium W5-47b TaxID=1130998 RepID=H9BX53_9BACT|nr:elongation factor Ts [uncultured bacterium W5-47b]